MKFIVRSVLLSRCPRWIVDHTVVATALANMDDHASSVPENFLWLALFFDAVPIQCHEALRIIHLNVVGAVMALKNTVGQRKSHDDNISEQPKLNLSDKSNKKNIIVT